MSDLISRSEAIQRLIEETEESKNNMIHINTAKRLLKDVDTAYSVDKVVKELEERTDFLKDCTKYGNKNAEQQEKSYNTMMMYEVADLVDDLIEIVKRGGVSDDVCEWEYKHPFGYFPSCKNVNSISRDRNWKYCPYCGKKIKVVE